MGLFTGVKAIFTGAKTADGAIEIAKKGTDGLIKGLDKLFYTAEEKSEASLKVTQAAIEMVKTNHGEHTIKSVTRRWLAWLIMGNFCFLVTLGALIYKIDSEWAKHILECAGLLSGMALAVSICYFGYYGLNAVIGKAKGR